jgi:glutamate-1-semialdehyde aminotransferase
VLIRRGIPGCAYGRASIFKTFIGMEAPPITHYDFSQIQTDSQTLLQGPPHASVLRQGMLLNGVDLMRVAGFVSAAHTDDVIEDTVRAFAHTLTRMQREGLLS